MRVIKAKTSGFKANSHRNVKRGPGDVCAEVAVDLDTSLVIQLHPNLLEAEVLQVRATANTHQDNV